MATVAECLEAIEREASAQLARERNPKRFYASVAWKRLRYAVLRESNGRCSYCGASPEDGHTILQVDHVEPISKNWARRLDKTNLTVSCGDCNHGKGASPAITRKAAA